MIRRRSALCAASGLCQPHAQCAHGAVDRGEHRQAGRRLQAARARAMLNWASAMRWQPRAAQGHGLRGDQRIVRGRCRRG